MVDLPVAIHTFSLLSSVFVITTDPGITSRISIASRTKVLLLLQTDHQTSITLLKKGFEKCLSSRGIFNTRTFAGDPTIQFIYYV